jgi:hypothetical protein
VNDQLVGKVIDSAAKPPTDVGGGGWRSAGSECHGCAAVTSFGVVTEATIPAMLVGRLACVYKIFL